MEELKKCQTQRQYHEKCDDIEKVMKGLRDKDREQEKTEFERIKSESKKRLDQSASKVRSEVDSIDTASRLDFELIRPALLYITQEGGNDELLTPLKKNIIDLWEKIIKVFGDQQQSPPFYIKIANEQIKDFVTKANEFESYLKIPCQRIREIFVDFVEKSLEKTASQLEYGLDAQGSPIKSFVRLEENLIGKYLE